MPKSNRSTIPDDRFDASDRIIATALGAERKGATMPYTSINGATLRPNAVTRQKRA